MSEYTQPTRGQTLSDAWVGLDGSLQAIMAFQRQADEPTIAPRGSFWIDASTDVLKVKGASAFGDLIDLANTTGPLLDAGGGVALSADLPAGGNVITGLGLGSSATDSVRVDQAVLRDGSQAMTGSLAMGGTTITGVANGTAANHAATIGQLVGALIDTGAVASTTGASTTVTAGIDIGLLVVRYSLSSGSETVDDAVVVLHADATNFTRTLGSGITLTVTLSATENDEFSYTISGTGPNFGSASFSWAAIKASGGGSA